MPWPREWWPGPSSTPNSNGRNPWSAYPWGGKVSKGRRRRGAISGPECPLLYGAGDQGGWRPDFGLTKRKEKIICKLIRGRRDAGPVAAGLEQTAQPVDLSASPGNGGRLEGLPRGATSVAPPPPREEYFAIRLILKPSSQILPSPCQLMSQGSSLALMACCLSYPIDSVGIDRKIRVLAWSFL
jgi:hypothetical protein